MDVSSNSVPDTTTRPTGPDEFDVLREVFRGLLVTVNTGTYVDHAYIERYTEPFTEQTIREAQKLILTTTTWLVREIAWTIRDNEIRTNAIFLIRRRPQ